MIKLSNIQISIDNKVILRNISFDIKNGSRIAIIGRSGVGKSSLLKVIAGLLMPTAGIVERNKEKEVSFLFQKSTLLPWKTVFENIKFFSGASDDKIKRLLGLVDLSLTLDLKPEMLSGGMLQRANLVCCVAGSPDVLLMDEPFSALDYLTRLENYDFLLSFIKNIPAFILVTHDINEAILFSNRVIILGRNKGEIIGDVKVDEEFKSSDQMLTNNFRLYYNSILEVIKND